MLDEGEIIEMLVRNVREIGMNVVWFVVYIIVGYDDDVMFNWVRLDMYFKKIFREVNFVVMNFILDEVNILL